MKIKVISSWKSLEIENGFQAFYFFPIIAYAKDLKARGVYFGWFNLLIFLGLEK